MNDDTLLALSDVLVIRALERSFSRTSRAGRRTSSAARYRAYESSPIPPAVHDQVLDGAWMLCPEMTTRHHVPVDADRWQRALDGYTRALLTTGRRHTTDGLERALAPLQVHRVA